MSGQIETTPGSAPPPAAASLGRTERSVIVALIVVFLAGLVAMLWLRDDSHWDRLVFLYQGLEALVFAGAGALFGTSVQRANVSDARSDATAARARAEAARTRAEKAAADGAALAEATRVGLAGLAAPSAGSERLGAREGDIEPRDAPAQLAELLKVADELFPRRR